MIERIPEQNDYTVELSNLQETLLFVVTISTFFFKYIIIGFFSDVYILTHVVLLWSLVKGFTHQFQFFTNDENALWVELEVTNTKNKPSFPQISKTTLHQYQLIMNQYEALISCSKLINSSLGCVMLPYLLETLFAAVASLNHGFTSSYLLIRGLASAYYFIGAAILVISAEIRRLVIIVISNTQ